MQMYTTGKEAVGSRRKTNDSQHAHRGADSHRYRPHLTVALVLILCSRLLSIPRWAAKPVTVIGLVLLGRSLLRFKRWGDEHRYVLRFGACFLAMLVELIIENCLVWLVAASDVRKYEHVPALQDNVEIALRWLGRHNHWVYRAVKTPWCETTRFLGMLLALAFSGLWDQVRGLMHYNGPIQGVCVESSTLNPIPGCYQRRFPPVPDTVLGVIQVGYTHIRGFGGCNDLIFSGHAAFWVLAPLALQNYYKGYRWVSWAAWVAVIQASLRDVIEKQHYSVDMLLAIIITWAVWTWLTWIYPPDQQLPARQKHAAADKPNPLVLGLIAFGLFAAGVIVIGGKA